MYRHSYKVIATIKPEISSEEQQIVHDRISDLTEKLRLKNIANDTYVKEIPFEKYQDFGAVAFFFCALKDMKEYFSKLEYHDLAFGKKKSAL